MFMSAIEMQISNEKRTITLKDTTSNIGESLLSFIEMDLDHADGNHPYVKLFQTNKKTLVALQAQYDGLVRQNLSLRKRQSPVPLERAEGDFTPKKMLYTPPSQSLYLGDLRDEPPEKTRGLRGVPDGVVTLASLKFNATGVNVSLEYRPRKIGKDYSLLEVYTVSDLATVCYLEFMRMAQLELYVRKCQNCGRYFIPEGEYDTKYCSNPAPGNTQRTCRQIGATNLFKEKVAESPVLSEYNKIYRRFHSRKRNGIITPDQFKAWTSQAKEIRDKAVADGWTVEQLKAEVDTISI